MAVSLAKASTGEIFQTWHQGFLKSSGKVILVWLYPNCSPRATFAWPAAGFAGESQCRGTGHLVIDYYSQRRGGSLCLLPKSCFAAGSCGQVAALPGVSSFPFILEAKNSKRHNLDSCQGLLGTQQLPLRTQGLGKVPVPSPSRIFPISPPCPALPRPPHPSQFL